MAGGSFGTGVGHSRGDASPSGGGRGDNSPGSGDRGGDGSNSSDRPQPEPQPAPSQNTQPAPSQNDDNPSASAEGVIGRALGLNRTKEEIQADIAGHGAGSWDKSHTYYNPPDVGEAWSEIAHNTVDVLGAFSTGLAFGGAPAALAYAGYAMTDADDQVNEFVSRETPSELQQLKTSVEQTKSDLESEVEKAVGPEVTEGIKTTASYAGFAALGFTFAGPVGALIGLGVRALAGPDPKEKEK